MGISGASFTDITLNTAAAFPYSPPAINKVAFIRSGDLMIMDSDGKNVKSLTSTSSDEDNPMFSPDGKVIVYEYGDDIWVINADGTNPRMFVVGASCPTWSFDGTKMAFVRRVSGYDYIYTINVDGSSVSRLTPTNTSSYNPAWSPDGKTISYYRDSALWTMSADGSNQKTIVTSITRGYSAWSPDGKKIAFRSDNAINTINPDGTGITQILGGRYSQRRHFYSRDGSKIYFSQDNGSNGFDAFMMNSNGNAVTNLTPNSTKDDYAPAPSPTSIPANAGQTTRKLIGTSGVLGASCAGFLLGQVDRFVASSVAFDTSPNTVAGRAVARINPLTSTETHAQNLIFTLSAGDNDTNKITTIKYQNATSAVATVTANTNAAYITFSANDGGVATIIPYIATKAANMGGSAVTQQGDIVTIRGTFLGVWDANGKNLAQNGATTIRLNKKTGVLVSFE
jgi:hypothetical protein